MEKIEIEDVVIHDDRKNDYELKSCCGQQSDRRLLNFIASLTISLIALLFACLQLTRNLGCSADSVYIGIVTSIISIWVPSPMAK